ncbi:hypothetical protein CLOM_g20101, partial [Closterium sp. NIES-68]
LRSQHQHSEGVLRPLLYPHHRIAASALSPTQPSWHPPAPPRSLLLSPHYDPFGITQAIDLRPPHVARHSFPPPRGRQ